VPSCPICGKRKATRSCPARAESICAVCCATEREVTIDCPSQCEYLIASRRYEGGRREVDWSTLPFPEIKIPPSFLDQHRELLDWLAFTISEARSRNRRLADRDAIAALKALAETYRTRASGLYYENPPASPDQRELYQALDAAVDDFRKFRARTSGDHVHDRDIRDALVALTQIGHMCTNHRPMGRAFLDFLRQQFPEEDFGRSSPSIVLPP
jgi:hypothetical protein